jgi:hypothetical protein
MNIPVRALLREKEAVFSSLGLGISALSDDQLIDAMISHPILMNRPIVETSKGVRLCRPSELVLGLLEKSCRLFRQRRRRSRGKRTALIKPLFRERPTSCVRDKSQSRDNVAG